MPALPPHESLVLEHNSHRLAQLSAVEGVALYAPRLWVSPEEVVKAIESDSIWMARWMPPDGARIEIRFASDLNVLLAAIAGEGPR